MRIRAKTILLVVMVVLVIVLGATLPVRHISISLLHWTKGLGPLGPVVVITFIVVLSVFLLPVFGLCIGSGFLFGFVWGVVTVSAGSLMGACSAFLVGRSFGRKWIEKKVRAHPYFEAIDDAVSRKGFTIVMLIRLSPVVPWNLSNYAFSLTRAPFWKYALGSWIGMLPSVIMYVYIGTGIRSLSDVSPGDVYSGTAGRVFLLAGLAATAVVTMLVTMIARRALARASTPQTDSQAPAAAAEQA